MAKALLGHVGGGPDARLVSEVRRLRERVRDLEREVELLRAANATLTDRAASEEILTLADPFTEQREPAYS